MKNAKTSLLPPFPSSKMSYLQNETKKLCTRPRLGQLENGLFDILWGTLVGVQNGKFENLRDSKKTTRKRDFETSLSRSGKNFLRHMHAQMSSKGDTPLHAFARPEVRPKEPSVQVTRLRRNAWLFLQISDHLFGWVY